MPSELLDRMGAPLDVDAYDWDRATDQPLSEQEVFQLTYAAQVEWGTEGTFESLAVTDDPELTRFLAIWLEQEVVHAQLLERLLEQHGHGVQLLHREDRHRRGARRGARLNRLAHRMLGDDFVALHMTWGAVNELTTMRFYSVLSRRTDNELLRQLLRDLMRQEALHYAYYRTAAIERLAESSRARRVVRLAMARLWSPVGSGLRDAADVERLMHSVFDPAPEEIVRIDATLSSIPGLEGLDLVARCVGAAPSPPGRPDCTGDRAA